MSAADGERSAPAAPDRDPPGCWLHLAVLGAAMVLSMATWFSATAVVPQLDEVWGLSGGQAAWLTIAVQLGFVTGALASAAVNLADRVPPRRLILYGSAGAALANGLLLVAPSVGAGIGLRAATGACLALVYPPAMKAMATWFRVKRGTALGVMVGALTLGSAVPHLVNGLGGLDWHVVIATTSLLTLGGGLLTEFVARDGPYPFPKGGFDPRKTWQVISDRGVLLASAGYFGHMWELYAMWAWIGVFLADTFALRGSADPLRAAALMTFAVIGIGALGSLAGGVLGDRWGRTRATSLAMALSGTCALAIGFAQKAPLGVLLVIALLWGFWVIADSAQFSTIVTEVADQSYVGTALTLQLAVGFTLTVATIWLIPLLEGLVGWRYAFAILALGPAAGIAAMLTLLSSPRSRAIAGGRG